MTQRIFILPIWIRLWHWTNAALMILLAISGASMHFSGTGWGILRFETAVKIHNFCGVTLLWLYGLFILANLFSGNLGRYLPEMKGFIGKSWKQIKFYCWGIFVGAPDPYEPTREASHNTLQQVMYWAVMYILVPIVLISGAMFLWPNLAPKEVLGLDGLVPVALVHYVAGVVLFGFTLMHIYLGTTGHKISSQFKTMVNGYHEME
ncbi:cytochrome b/b6 domain-containing protein [Tropicimonas sp. IMCC6043]|uniref:cytochrome b/b6 domain-containing protein n=1 Tax=Tropicimonas sp. IMCC6043 TaxID=2510645 RepID=UPI00101DA660|nr:cytochrome b/b6 domain-containing protein [Tropicimonas sp. IMCC6043]RYH08831.1 cytochrome B [Tropicimonas sp. IMCC6043]